MHDRSSAPHRIARKTPDTQVAAIAALRRIRFTGLETVEVLGMPLSMVSGILTRIGRGTVHDGLEREIEQCVRT